jgi:hypothetical protein
MALWSHLTGENLDATHPGSTFYKERAWQRNHMLSTVYTGTAPSVNLTLELISASQNSLHEASSQD